MQPGSGDESPPQAPSLPQKASTDSKAKPPRRRLVRRQQGKVFVTPAGRELIEQAAADGVTKTLIAKALGVGYDTFKKLLARDPRAQEAFDLGNAQNETELRNLLMEKARAGNVTAAIYLTKARHGWTEGEAPEQRPNITINLPGAVSPEEYAKQIRRGETIEHED